MSIIRNYFLPSALCAGLLWVEIAHAAIERLDDSASPRAQVQAQIVTGDNGQPLLQSRGATRATIKFGAVDYRLATARFVGKRARIYYVIPALVNGLMSPDGLLISWRSIGKFSNGNARPGDRVPVWTGTINEAWMNESFDLTMTLDLRRYHPRGRTPFALESYFEIETLP